MADGCHAVRESDGGQAAAVSERPNADGCDAVRKGDVGQIAAVSERIIAGDMTESCG